MASIRLVQEIKADYHPAVAEKVSQLELPYTGLLLTLDGVPLMIVDPMPVEDDGSVYVHVKLPLKAKVEYDAYLREHCVLEVGYPEGSIKKQDQ
jgi:hypothetical protein